MISVNYKERPRNWTYIDLRLRVEQLLPTSVFNQFGGHTHKLSFLANPVKQRDVFLRSVNIGIVVSRVRELIASGKKPADIADEIEDEFEVEPNMFVFIERDKEQT